MAPTNPRSTYRHGDLRSASIAEAYRLIAKVGRKDMSMRSLADVLGVAHRSLYNHFKDREALLDAVAAHGFGQLADRLSHAEDGRSFIEGFVSFALSNPEIYALMTGRPHATMKDRPALQSAVHRVIGQAMVHFCSPTSPPEEKRRTVMKVYIIIHGGLSLYAFGALDVSSSAALVDELVAMTANP